MSLLRCQNLVKKYGSSHALDGVDLALEAGAPIALIGPNASPYTQITHRPIHGRFESHEYNPARVSSRSKYF